MLCTVGTWSFFLMSLLEPSDATGLEAMGGKLVMTAVKKRRERKGCIFRWRDLTSCVLGVALADDLLRTEVGPVAEEENVAWVRLGHVFVPSLAHLARLRGALGAVSTGRSARLLGTGPRCRRPIRSLRPVGGRDPQVAPWSLRPSHLGACVIRVSVRLIGQ